jgi:DNA (cytosine-5)-methyltransferase 1
MGQRLPLSTLMRTEACGRERAYNRYMKPKKGLRYMTAIELPDESPKSLKALKEFCQRLSETRPGDRPPPLPDGFSLKPWTHWGTWGICVNGRCYTADIEPPLGPVHTLSEIVEESPSQKYYRSPALQKRMREILKGMGMACWQGCLVAEAGGCTAKYGHGWLARLNKHQTGRVYCRKSLGPTLTAGDSGPLFWDEDGLRLITPLEKERMQGLPDNWTEGVSDMQRSRQLGNSVVLPMSEEVIRRLVECHNNQESHKDG